jgi:hypothetical protein
MSAGIAAGARVRILTGMAGNRVGAVLSVRPGYSGTVVNVEVEIPVLLTDPDGPSQVVQMPYAPDELEVLVPEPAAALAGTRGERRPGDAAARSTAACAIVQARSRGLHGRAALEGAYQSLRSGMLFLLHGDSPHADRWGRACTLVFERWAALEDDVDAPVPYVVAETPVERATAPKGDAR